LKSPSTSAAKFAERCPVKGAVGQDRFYLCHRCKMVSNRRDAVTPLKRIAKNAAGGARAGYRNEIIAIMVIKEVPQGALGYAGLNRDNAHVGIKIGNTVKPAQIKDDAAVFNRIGTTVAPVIARAYGINRNLPALRNLKNRCDLLLVLRAEHSRN